MIPAIVKATNRAKGQRVLFSLLLVIAGAADVALADRGPKRMRRLPDAAVPINLYELLGPDAYARGVIWQPMNCYAPTSQRIEGEVQEGKLKQLEDMLEQDLLQALSDATHVPVTSLSRQSSFPGVVVGPSLDMNRLEHDMSYRKHALRPLSSDPRYWRWLRAMSLAVLKYTVDHKDPALGKKPMACINDTIAAIFHWGLFNDPNARIGTVLQRVIRDPGWCSVRPLYEPYGVWLKKERMMSRSRDEQRFRFDNRHKDRVMFLFDILYESENAFKRQHWLGAVAQQNPFDMYGIMDLIHTLEPDLIVETGTANGGSALMWASMLHLTRPGLGRVITVDVNDPVVVSWAGVSAKDPTKNPLWSQYVTFLKLEAEAYCPLVTNGSYCVVEDTKLSRFSAVGGPTPGIQRFLDAHPDFVVDREREPFYTQHVGGYLMRVIGGERNKTRSSGGGSGGGKAGKSGGAKAGDGRRRVRRSGRRIRRGMS
ncbi:hypothetical protein VOLCADRAFT_87175 [Volvox carteri f. nagariensis]|uniref:Rhamnosyl O-methyltransferase n=1 Tax=Volvox carteri f. nagariensis TaxID=3068 RepID=D8TKD5_VOLCA|nr:uncharacterized protein VOLCADRAFT_87175 [Volvox carteri f. nagariensis]EFJ52043.1 hypothetical protein VOLCADRAFT_87175 [Volvox carteri f. nagariensis]|eukprot:XP_002946817.1 hypothetical protein VOLCADRAFT_87175 [Volvox carteri f. nagariensis]